MSIKAIGDHETLRPGGDEAIDSKQHSDNLHVFMDLLAVNVS